MRNQLLALGQAPQVDDVHQLAQAFEQRQGPGLNTMTIIRGVPVADVSIASGQWSRMGRMVSMEIALAWLNTNPLAENFDLIIEVPWELQTGQDIHGTVSPSGNLRNDGGGAYYSVTEALDALSIQVAFMAGNLSGAPETLVRVGGPGIDGPGNARSLRLMVTYWTNGAWNPAWPRVDWAVVGDQSAPADIDYTFYGAFAGDNISVRDQNDVEIQSNPVAGPSTATGLLAGEYTLVHRGYRSQPISVVNDI
jgi:hypothetical protein